MSRTELSKHSARTLRATENCVADYCSIRETMREVNACLSLDDDFESVTPMNG